MADNFSGQQILITGAGLAPAISCALAFSKAGATCHLADASASRLKAAVHRIEKAGGTAGRGLRTNLRSYSDVRRAVKTIEQYCGELGGVLHCLQAPATSSFLRQPVHEFRRQLESTLLSAAWVLRAAALPMSKRGAGWLGVLLSGAAGSPRALHSAGDAAQAGLLAMLSGIRPEFTAKGLRLSVILIPDGAAAEDAEAIADLTLRGIADGRALIGPGWRRRFAWRFFSPFF